MANKKDIGAFCVKCRKPVVIESPEEKPVRGKTAYVGACPDCKGPVMVYKADVEYLAAEKKSCPKCQSELLSSDKKCQFCGEDFEKKDEEKKTGPHRPTPPRAGLEKRASEKGRPGR